MKEIWNESCILSPSLICLDMCNLERSKDTGKQWNQDAACRYSGWTFQSKYAAGT